MLRKKAEQFEEFLQRVEQGEKAEEPWAGLVQTAQEVARLAPVPPPPRRLSPGRQRLLTEAVRLREGKTTQRRRVVPIMSKMKLASVVVAMLLFFAAVSGTGYALADDSLPGEPLYGLKGAFEQARVNLTRSPEAKAELAIDLAQLRLEEVAQLLEKGQTVDQKTVNAAQEHLREAIQATKYSENLEEQAGNVFRHAYQRMTASFGTDTPVGPVRELFQYMEQTRAGQGAADGTTGAQTATHQQTGPNGPPTEGQVEPSSQLEIVNPVGANGPDARDAAGHYGAGANDGTQVLTPPNQGDEAGFGYGPGLPYSYTYGYTYTWQHRTNQNQPVPPGPGTGSQTGTGDGAQIGTGVSGQNQNGTGPGTGGVNSSGQDGGTNGGTDGGTNGGTNGGSNGGSSGGGNGGGGGGGGGH